MLRKFSALAIFSDGPGLPMFEAQDSHEKKLHRIFQVLLMLIIVIIFIMPKIQVIMNNYTSFTNSQNSFELGMASVKAEYTTGKVTGIVDLGFGRRADEFSYNDKGTGLSTAIKQAYISVSSF